MNRIGALLFGLAVAAIGLISARDVIYPGLHLVATLPPAMLALGFAGWLLATIGPFALSLWFWRVARRVRPTWGLHLLFIPCAFALLRAGTAILFFAAGVPDGDSLEGHTLLAAFLLFVLTALIHAAAAIWEGAAHLRRRANSG